MYKPSGKVWLEACLEQNQGFTDYEAIPLSNEAFSAIEVYMYIYNDFTIVF